MKNSKHKKIIITFILLFAMGTTPKLFAQLPPVFDGFVDDDGTGDPTAPIDGLLGIAMAAGAYYGAKKLVKKKK